MNTEMCELQHPGIGHREWAERERPWQTAERVIKEFDGDAEALADEVVRLRADTDPAHTWEDVAGEYANQRDNARRQRDLLGQALGSLLVHLGVVNDTELTGPELLAATQNYIDYVESQGV